MTAPKENASGQKNSTDEDVEHAVIRNAAEAPSPRDPVRPAAREEQNHVLNTTREKAATGASTAQETAGTAVDNRRHWDCATTQSGPTSGPKT